MTKTNWTIEKLQKEAKKYNSKIDFLKGSPNAYASASRRGILDEIFTDIKRKKKDPTEYELSGTELLKQFEKKIASSKKDWNRNVLSVRTNDELHSLIKEYCLLKDISANRFLNNLLQVFFKV